MQINIILRVRYIYLKKDVTHSFSCVEVKPDVIQHSFGCIEVKTFVYGVRLTLGRFIVQLAFYT